MKSSAWKHLVLGGFLALQVTLATSQSVPGVTPVEVKLGQTMPLSGPVSAYGMFGRASQAYFEMINAQGGVAGRQVKLVTLDDAYSPPKAFEQTRKLVEQERVLAMLTTIGSAQNNAIKGYLFERKVPMLFAGIGVNIWGSPEQAKWSTMFAPDHAVETGAYARHLLKTMPNAKIAILTANDDTGRYLLASFKESLGAKRSLIVAEATFEHTDPTVDSQLLALKNSGADTFVNLAAPRAASQAIRKAHELGWKPRQYLLSFSASIENVLKPAGLGSAVGIISSTYMKDPADPTWKDDAGVISYREWLKKYLPEGNPSDPMVLQGFSVGELVVHVLGKTGKNLDRDSLMTKAKSVKDLQLSMLIPGIKINTSPQDPSGIHEMRLETFDGVQWKLID